MFRVYQAQSLAEAHAIADVLRGAGLSVMPIQGHGPLPFGVEVDVHVSAESDQVPARQLVAEHMNEALENSSGEPETGHGFGVWAALLLFAFVWLAVGEAAAYLTDHFFFQGISDEAMDSVLGQWSWMMSTVNACFSLAVVWAFAALMQESFSSFCAVHRVSWDSMLRSLGYNFLILVLGAVVYAFFNIPAVDPAMEKEWATAGSPVLFVLVVSLVVPWVEEFIFRGFLFTGVLRSWGGVPAVILTSLIWSTLHIQYEWPVVFVLFVQGIAWGITRIKTGSILPAFAAHVAWNFFCCTYFF